MSHVRDYMNPHMLYLRSGNRVELALRPILDFGLTAVPILDEEYFPVGIVSLRDLVDGARRARPTVVHTILVSSSLTEAAIALATHDLHHLVVVDENGKAVGMLSSLDIVRGLAGLEPKRSMATDRSAIGDVDELEPPGIDVP
jgi:CBS domain-containing protein